MADQDNENEGQEKHHGPSGKPSASGSEGGSIQGPQVEGSPGHAGSGGSGGQGGGTGGGGGQGDLKGGASA